jgi:1,4-alpha-glucan branching enzyme
LSHPDVQAHLLQATALWMDEFDVDGLRLDAR